MISNPRRGARLLAATLMATAVAAVAQTPLGILYQGRLKLNGASVNGTVPVTLRLTSADGSSEYWTSGPTSVVVSSGSFRYMLGAPNEAAFKAIDWNVATPYVELTVNGTTLLPRERLSSTPYALLARGLAAGATIQAGALDMAGNRITTVGAPTQPADAANKAYVDSAVSGAMNASGNIVAGGTFSSTNSMTLGAGHWNLEGMNYQALNTFGGLTVRGNSLNVGNFSIGAWTNNASTGGLHVAGDSHLMGSVGIGTDSPSSKLTVAGDVRLTAGKLIFPDGSAMATAGGGSVSSAQIAPGTFQNGTYTFPGALNWGDAGSRTDFKDDAGAIASRSGFFQTAAPVNYYAGASGWQHLIEARHSNPGNNYALQIAGSFFDQSLYFRKTNNSATTAWSKLVAENGSGKVGIGTAAPYARLTVDYSAADDSWNTAAFHNGSLGPNWSHIHWGRTGDWYIRSAASAGTVVIQDSGGNVGIGTANPGAKLDVQGGAIKATGGLILQVFSAADTTTPRPTMTGAIWLEQ